MIRGGAGPGGGGGVRGNVLRKLEILRGDEKELVPHREQGKGTAGEALFF